MAHSFPSGARSRQHMAGLGRARGRGPSGVRRCLWSALVLGLALLSACTVRLELGEHRFAKGDLAATSMGLVAHERWLAREPDRIAAAVRPSRRVVARHQGRTPEPAAPRNGAAGRSGVRLVTLADNLALAGPNSLARLIASLSGGGSVAPALGPPEARLAANRAAYPGLGGEEATPAPRPAPNKPEYSPGPTSIPEPKPLAWRAQALGRSAPPPPPARPSMATAPGWHLG